MLISISDRRSLALQMRIAKAKPGSREAALAQEELEILQERKEITMNAFNPPRSRATPPAATSRVATTDSHERARKLIMKTQDIRNPSSSTRYTPYTPRSFKRKLRNLNQVEAISNDIKFIRSWLAGIGQGDGTDEWHSPTCIH